MSDLSSLSHIVNVLLTVRSFHGAIPTHWEFNVSVLEDVLSQLRLDELNRYAKDAVAWGPLVMTPFKSMYDSPASEITGLYGYPVKLSERKGWRLCFTLDGKETAYDGE